MFYLFFDNLFYRCSHIEITFDPGHVKKSFQKSLIKLFGKKKIYKFFSSRIAQWFMRSLCEAKSLHPTNRSAIQNDFCNRMKFLLSHYTNPTCDPGCPCQAIKHTLIPPNCVCDFLIMPAMANFFARISSAKELSKFRLVCRHWNLLIQNHYDDLDKQQHKVILPAGDEHIPALEELVISIFDLLLFSFRLNFFTLFLLT